MKDFFVSYNRADRKWAEWIAWQLEEAGYAVIVQAWDIRPGSNFILEMHKAARETERTIAVLSPAYLSALYTQPEWAAALIQDPTGEKKKLLPVRVQDCTPDGLLAAVVYIDLVGKDAESAQQMLLAGVKEERTKPSQPPAFPPSDQRYVPEQPRFPVSAPQAEKKERRWFHWVSGTDEIVERRNRQVMVDKVRQYWITGVLQQSLYKEVMITMGLAERPTAVDRPLDVLVQRPDGSDRPLPPEIKIGEVFDELRGSLLILGAPGSGKTTLLLELTRDLLDQAEQDSSFPIPVVLPLSTWGERRLPLAGWLIDELTKRYDVPQKVAQAWIEHDGVLPLLDGLDEVKEEHRAACVETINGFRMEHGFLLPLAVCCRVADYDTIGKRLRLQGAILVQPLMRQQVESYLDQLGECGIGVRNALQEDSTLWELAEAPLLLNVMTLAYSKETDVLLFAGKTPEARRDHLFTAYVNRMFQRRNRAASYTKEQTLNWLSWLAQQMQQNAQTVFYIERLQPNWLSARQQKILNRGCLLLVLILFQCCTGLISGLIYGPIAGPIGGPIAGLSDGLIAGLGFGLIFGLFTGLIFGLFTGLSDGLIAGLIGGLIFGLFTGLGFGLGFGLTFGLIYGLIFGLIFGLIAEIRKWFFRRHRRNPQAMSEAIRVIEAVRWSWRQFLSSIFPNLGYGLSVGLITGLITGLSGWLGGGLSAGLIGGLSGWFGGGLIFGLGAGLSGGLSGDEIERKVIPNQGIKRSARNAVIYGLSVGLIGGLFAGLFTGLIFGLIGGLLGLKVGLSGGLIAGLKVRGLSVGLFAGLKVGLIAGLKVGLSVGPSGGLFAGLFTGLTVGGFACLQHFCLRILLVRNNSAPWNYPGFLDYAAEHVFLRKVGGGYMFIHRMLLEHFASLKKTCDQINVAERVD